MNVFVIDGSKIGSVSLATAFANQDHIQIVGFAESANGILDSVRRVSPDVVILDIEMPGRSGIAVLRELKREIPALPVIVFTRVSAFIYREKCKAAGADYFFDKFREVQNVPLALKALTLRIHRHSDTHK